MTLVCIYITLHHAHLPGKAGLGSLGQDGEQAAARLLSPSFLVFKLEDESRPSQTEEICPALVETPASPD